MALTIDKNQREKLNLLQKKSSIQSLVLISGDYLLIFFAYLLISISFYFLPITILIIGSRQRALSNLTHDASHVNLSGTKTVNDIISNLFCAFPMFETVKSYRESHMLHHQFLGDIEKDPDSKSHLLYGYNDQRPWRGNPFKNYFNLVFNLVALRVSFFGYLFNLSLKDLLYVISWWIFLLGLMVCILGLQFSLIVVGLWFIAKATSYHLIRLFAEFMDHTGLDYKNDVSLFSRNLPDWGFLRFIFHPNHDTYHIIHHLFPRIPVYNLRKADLILRELEGYNQLHRCDGYFFGDHSAVKCWVGRCQKGNM